MAEACQSYIVSNMPSQSSCEHTGRLVLLRHGQTVWSESGQHTGRTNIPLTDKGCEQAKDAGMRILHAFPDGFDEDCVYASPLRRAIQTAQLAGFKNCQPLPAAMEWDYGGAEGRTRKDVANLSGSEAWDVWSDGPTVLPSSMLFDGEETLPSGESVHIVRTSGESLECVYERTGEIIDTVLPKLNAGNDVLLVAHAHILRILTMKWLGIAPTMARMLRLDTAHYCVLGVYKGDRVIVRWNC